MKHATWWKRTSTLAISESGSVANRLTHCRLPLPFVNVCVVLQPSGVERVFFPCRAVVEDPAVGGSLQKWTRNPTIAYVLFEWTPECSASPGSTSGASATSASRNFLIDLSSLAQTAFMQRLNAMIKTTVRITLAKLAKVKGQLYQNHR